MAGGAQAGNRSNNFMTGQVSSDTTQRSLMKNPFHQWLLLALTVGNVSFATVVQAQPTNEAFTNRTQRSSRAPTYADIARIRDEGLNRSQLMETLGYLTDVVGPRLTGSRHLKRAR